MPPKKPSQKYSERPPDSTGKTAKLPPPYLIIQGTIARRAKELGINRIHLSLTHDEPMAIAIATAEYLSDAELAHLQKFNPESYRLSVIAGDNTDD